MESKVIAYDMDEMTMRGHVKVFYFRYYPDSNRPVSDLRLGIYPDIVKADIRGDVEWVEYRNDVIRRRDSMLNR